MSKFNGANIMQDCGCVICHDLPLDNPDVVFTIEYCPKHAAAPEMFAALERLLSSTLKATVDGDLDWVDGEDLYHAEQALVKAEGKEGDND